MINRPPVREIIYTTAEGNPGVFFVGCNCTEIREVEESGEFCFIPWVEVWEGEKLIFRANQHKLEHIRY